MKRNSSYLTRAMQARDPRFAAVLTKLGHRVPAVLPAVRAETFAQVDDVAALRAEYEALIGKRPFMGWDGNTLRAKIAAAKAG